MELSYVVKEAQALWISIPLDEAYYDWIDCIDADWPAVPWKDMTDEQAEQAIKAFTAYIEKGE